MKLLIGLGNPGAEYAQTRHNAGFEAIDRLAARLEISVFRSRVRAMVAEARINEERVILVKPQTFMNNSGESVREAAVVQGRTAGYTDPRRRYRPAAGYAACTPFRRGRYSQRLA